GQHHHHGAHVGTRQERLHRMQEHRLASDPAELLQLAPTHARSAASGHDDHAHITRAIVRGRWTRRHLVGDRVRNVATDAHTYSLLAKRPRNNVAMSRISRTRIAPRPRGRSALPSATNAISKPSC